MQPILPMSITLISVCEQIVPVFVSDDDFNAHDLNDAHFSMRQHTRHCLSELRRSVSVAVLSSLPASPSNVVVPSFEVPNKLHGVIGSISATANHLCLEAFIKVRATVPLTVDWDQVMAKCAICWWWQVDTYHAGRLNYNISQNQLSSRHLDCYPKGWTKR